MRKSLAIICLLLAGVTQAAKCDTTRNTEPAIQSGFWCTQPWISFYWELII